MADPYWSNVSLLLPFDGSNGGTTLTDAKSGSNLTASGVTTATDLVKFGTASGKFTGTDATPVLLPTNANLTLTGDFTIECWLYVTTTNPNMILLGSNYSPGGINHQIQINQDGTSKIGMYNGTWRSTSTTVSISANTWHFLALSRSGSTLRIYLDGNQIGAGISAPGTFDFSAGAVGMLRGDTGDIGQAFVGRMDDFRITKGVARYTGTTMTVPTDPFLDTGSGVALAASASATATLSGALSVGAPLAAGASATADLSGTLAVGTGFAGSASATATLSGVLAVDAPLVADASATATLSGDLAVGVPLSAAAQAEAALSGTLAVQATLAASAEATAALAGDLSVGAPLAADATASATLSGTLYARAPITDADYAAWLAGDHPRCLLVEIGCWHDGAADTVYLSNLGYVSPATDADPNRSYDELLAAPPTLTLGLDSPLAVADIEVWNVDGSLDPWLQWSWDGRPVAWWLGDPSWSRADFRQIFAGRVDSIAGNGPHQLALKVRDLKEWINRPLQSNLIAGGPNKGTEVPLLFGFCRNISPPLVDPAAVSITVLTAVGTTATAYCAAGHPYSTGALLFIDGAEEDVYNSNSFDSWGNPVPSTAITVIDGHRFSYALPEAAPTSPATGAVFATAAKVHTVASLVVSSTDPDTGKPIATAHIPGGHPFVDGQIVTIAAAIQAAWNGDWRITVVNSTDFSYTLAVAPTDANTGDEVDTATGAIMALPTLLTYQFNGGAAQSIVALRDKGFPLSPASIAVDAAHGRFTLARRADGQLTADAWGVVGPDYIPSTLPGGWVEGLTYAVGVPLQSVSAVRYGGDPVSGWTADLPAGRVALPASLITATADIVEPVATSGLTGTCNGDNTFTFPALVANPANGDHFDSIGNVRANGIAMYGWSVTGDGVVALSFPLTASTGGGGSAPLEVVFQVYDSNVDSHFLSDPAEHVSGGVYRIPLYFSWQVVTLVLVGVGGTAWNGEALALGPPSTVGLTDVDISDLTGLTVKADVVRYQNAAGVALSPIASPGSPLGWQYGGDITAFVHVYLDGSSVSFMPRLGLKTAYPTSPPPGAVGIDCMAPSVGAADIVRALVALPVPDEDDPGSTRPLLPADRIDEDNFAAFKARCPAGIGYYTGTARLNAVAALDEIMAAVGGFWGFSRTGKLRLWRLDAPAGDPVAAFDVDDIVALQFAPLATELPVVRQRVGCQRNHTVQDRNALSPLVPSVEAQRYGLAYLAPPGIANNAGVLGPHQAPLDPALVPSLYYTPADAQAEARRLAAMRATVRRRFQATLRATALGLNLGDVIQITHPRWGFEAGALAVVLGVQESPTLGQTTLTLWC